MEWKIENSRFYAEIMEAAVKYFGLDAETTTEAELHQHLTTAESVDSIRASMKTEVETAVSAEVQGIKTQLADLTTTVETLQTALNESNAKVETLQTALNESNTKVAELQSTINTKDAEIETAKTQNAQLAAEIAKLKVGQNVQQPGDDPGLPVESNANQNGTVLSATEFAQRLGIK